MAAQRTTYNSTSLLRTVLIIRIGVGRRLNAHARQTLLQGLATFAKSPFKITPSTRVVRRGRRASSLVSFALGLPYLLSHSWEVARQATRAGR